MEKFKLEQRVMFKGKCLEGTWNLLPFLWSEHKQSIVKLFFLKIKRIAGGNICMFKHNKTSYYAGKLLWEIMEYSHLELNYRNSNNMKNRFKVNNANT